jgi:hypothetical protein
MPPGEFVIVCVIASRPACIGGVGLGFCCAGAAMSGAANFWAASFSGLGDGSFAVGDTFTLGTAGFTVTSGDGAGTVADGGAGTEETFCAWFPGYGGRR